MLGSLLIDYPLAPDVSRLKVATQTAALVGSDLFDLITRAKAASFERVMGIMYVHPAQIWSVLIPPSVIRECTGADLARTTIALTAVDFEVALLKARASYSESIGAPKIPDVSWDDVGGLAHVKSDILDTIQLPLDHPELFADGLKKRSGIYLSTQCVFGLTFVDKGFFFMDHPGLAKLWLRKR
jgi:peroxin-6